MQPNFQLQNCFFYSIFEIFTHKKENPNIEKHLRFLIRFLYFLRSLANLFLCTANLCNCSFSEVFLDAVILSLFFRKNIWGWHYIKSNNFCRYFRVLYRKKVAKNSKAHHFITKLLIKQ